MKKLFVLVLLIGLGVLMAKTLSGEHGHTH